MRNQNKLPIESCMGLPAQKIEQQFQIDRRDMGRADTLRYNVMTYVVEENYDRAIDELKSFMEKDSEYPQFKEKILRYVEHGVDLVHAIRAKRKFPGIHSLTVAKQQELSDRFHEHFKELQYILQKIEMVQQEMRLNDIRSTVYVVKSFFFSVIAIAILAFLLDISKGLLLNAWVVIDDLFLTSTDWLFKTLGI